jgi:hypothetical protein
VPYISGPDGNLDEGKALVALEKIGGVKVISPLMKALTDEDEGRRKLAEEILEKANGSL